MGSCAGRRREKLIIPSSQCSAAEKAGAKDTRADEGQNVIKISAAQVKDKEMSKMTQEYEKVGKASTFLGQVSRHGLRHDVELVGDLEERRGEGHAGNA
jgi:hypothetical protein